MSIVNIHDLTKILVELPFEPSSECSGIAALSECLLFCHSGLYQN